MGRNGSATQASVRCVLRFCLVFFCGLGAVVGTSACDRSSASDASSVLPRIQLNTQLNTVDVSGLPRASLDALSRASLTSDDWQALLRVSVAGPNGGGDRRPAVVGTYKVVDGILRFTPTFPFDEGRQYDVVLDPARFPGASLRTGTIAAVVGRPAVDRSPSTVVSRVYPSGDVVPANQLRLYIHFSAPMDWRSGYDFVHLLDDRGQEVVDAFLPLDADFWNDDRTRYTVFFDPGRVKRGILPNRQMGRALEAGRRYTLVVKREWRDSHGLPLKEEFRREFSVAPAIERPLAMDEWNVEAPRAGTRAPVSVTFPSPLDHGLLRRALGVARAGTAVAGEATVDAGESRWQFTPRDPWSAGEHQLVALGFLEDLAGNRIGRAFEVDDFERTDRTPEPERHTRAFRVVP
jgi:hypothetical protein